MNADENEKLKLKMSNQLAPKRKEKRK